VALGLELLEQLRVEGSIDDISPLAARIRFSRVVPARTQAAKRRRCHTELGQDLPKLVACTHSDAANAVNR